jgi:hypothetical protein
MAAFLICLSGVTLNTPPILSLFKRLSEEVHVSITTNAESPVTQVESAGMGIQKRGLIPEQESNEINSIKKR